MYKRKIFVLCIGMLLFLFPHGNPVYAESLPDYYNSPLYYSMPMSGMKSLYGDVYTVAMQKSGRIKLSGNFTNCRVEMYDKAGKPIDVAGLINGEGIYLLAGEYKLGIQSGAAGIGSYLFTTSYINGQETFSEDIYFNNDKIANAYLLKEEQQVCAHIAQNETVDYYKFTLDKPSVVEFGLTADGFCRYGLWDSSQIEWAYGFAEGTREHSASSVEAWMLDAGTYYLEIFEYVAGDNQEYSFGHDMEYQFSCHTTENSAVVTGNNAPEQAAAIRLGGSVSGQLSQNERLDYYKLQLESRTPVTFSVEAYGNLQDDIIPVKIRITDVSGNAVLGTESDDLFARIPVIADFGEVELKQTVLLESGEYLIEAEGAGVRYQLGLSEGKLMADTSVGKPADCVYSGEKIQPEITITCGGTELSEGFDYELTYLDNQNIGTASIQIDGIGAFAGTKTVTYRILPGKASLTSVTAAGTTKIKLKWKKDSDVTGYEIYRSTNKKSGYKRIKTIPSANTVSFTDSGLKKGTRYYYKLRSYKTVSGVKYYGEYSMAETIKG